MKPTVGTLPPPNTPAGLPHGLERGGIFEASYVPPQYIDAQRRTVPTDSPVTHNVSTDVFMQPVAFRRPDQVRVITGVGQLPTVVHPFGQPPGYQRYYTSYDKQHRHAVDLPAATRMASGHRHGYGQMIQGMGPQPGYRKISADMAPRPIHGWRPVDRPMGMEEGGIFGRGSVVGGMATGGEVPGVPTKEIMEVRQITGFGAGPDGIG
jgi:hypothetical protein